MLVLLLLGNSTALNSLLYRGDFPKKNIGGSHFSIYKRIFNQLLTEQSARHSFFLQMIFLGKVHYSEGLLLECDSAVYMQAKLALENCQIDYVEGDVFQTAAAMKGTIDFLSLSDVPSFLPPQEESGFLQKVKAGLDKNAFVLVRAHLRRPAPTLAGFIDISMAHAQIFSKELTRLWSFHLYKPA